MQSKDESKKIKKRVNQNTVNHTVTHIRLTIAIKMKWLEEIIRLNKI